MRIMYIPKPVSLITTVKYGALFNWYAATDARRITSSDDWIVLSSDQYRTLSNDLGAGGNYSTNIVGGYMKIAGTEFFITPNLGADNTSGWNGKASGERNPITGAFFGLNSYVYYMCSNNYTADSTRSASLSYDSAAIVSGFGSRPKKAGSPIRLLYVGSGTPTSYIGSDLKVYRIINIAGKYYTADNLIETKYRNGDWIDGYDGGVYTPITNANWAAKTTGACCVWGDDLSNM